MKSLQVFNILPHILSLKFLLLIQHPGQQLHAMLSCLSCLLWMMQLRRWFLVSWHFFHFWAHFKRLQTLTQGLQGRRGEGKEKVSYPNGHNQMTAAELEQKWYSTYFCIAPWSPRQRLDPLSCLYPLKRTSMDFHRPTHLRAFLLFPWLPHHSQCPAFSHIPTRVAPPDHPSTTHHPAQPTKRFFFLPPELKAQPLGTRPTMLLPSLDPHWLFFFQGPLSGSSPLFSVSFQNNQPARVLMSSETSEQWVKSASKQNVV